MGKRMVCEWTEIEEFNGMIFWESDCCQSFQFTEGGTPTENDFAFCPFCGKSLIVKELERELADDND